MLPEVCGAGSREPGAATCQPDAHGIGRQVPDGEGGFSTSRTSKEAKQRLVLEVCGAGSREPGAATCHPDAHGVGSQI
jgi:hypothetical protein